MGDFGKFLTKAFLRKLLTMLGTFLLTHGIVSEAEAGGFVSDYLEEIAGGVLIGSSHLWEYLYQRYVKEKVVTALALPEGASPAELEAALQEKKEGY